MKFSSFLLALLLLVSCAEKEQPQAEETVVPNERVVANRFMVIENLQPACHASADTRSQVIKTYRERDHLTLIAGRNATVVAEGALWLQVVDETGLQACFMKAEYVEPIR